MFKTVKFIKNNIRYILASMAMLMFLVIGKSFPAEVVKTEDCKQGKCTTIENYSLSDENMDFYANDVFNSAKTGKEYYRLTFRDRANKDSRILIKISNSFDEEEEIKVLDIKASQDQDDNFQEIYFSTQNNKTDIVFSKKEKDESSIFIDNVQAIKLNISNSDEISSLKPTIFGKNDYSVVDQEQDDNSEKFSRLSEPGIMFGQFFQPEFNYITGVSLSMDVVKQDKWVTDGKYRIELREAQNDYGTPIIKNETIAQKTFTLDDLNNYRQSDGTFKFPLYAMIDPQKSYFIGINNDKVDVNRFNYLELRGTSDDSKYDKGRALVKRNRQTFFATGDLYFKTHGIKSEGLENKKILQGSVIEDTGGGKGYFSFRCAGKSISLVDVYLMTNDVSFDEGKLIISGNDYSDYQSSYIYKFETLYPALKFKITAKQADLTWDRVTLSYSFDGDNWIKIPEKEDGIYQSGSDNKFKPLQNFEFEQSEKTPKSTIYLKVEPENYFTGSKNDSKKYGIKDFYFGADLLMK
jgi:hypothetical protein